MSAYRRWWRWSVAASAWCWERLLSQLGRDARCRKSMRWLPGTNQVGATSRARWIGPPEPAGIEPLLPADVPSRWIAELQSRREAGPPLDGAATLITLSDHGVVMAFHVCESGWNQAGHVICLAPRALVPQAGCNRD